MRVDKLMGDRLGLTPPATYDSDLSVHRLDGVAEDLKAHGGYAQQDRMIRDKELSLKRALQYSYLGAKIMHYPIADGEPVPQHNNALINPNKLKEDYDEKILSVEFKYGYTSGDIFKWLNTNTYWIIYLQELTELAYFRGNIKRCTYLISWLDEDKNVNSTYAAVRGPVETRILSIQKHDIVLDYPNYSLNLMLPTTEETLKYFRRYAKFYLRELRAGQEDKCWRVEAINDYGAPGILDIVAVEYYANTLEDDMENGVVGGLVQDPIDPNVEPLDIKGESFILPKKEYIYTYTASSSLGEWSIKEEDLPLILESYIDDKNQPCLKVKWNATYIGTFTIVYNDTEKIVTVKSLF